MVFYEQRKFYSVTVCFPHHTLCNATKKVALSFRDTRYYRNRNHYAHYLPQFSVSSASVLETRNAVIIILSERELDSESFNVGG